jgi:hypothetical protein
MTKSPLFEAAAGIVNAHVALARTITDATSREPVVTRIDFAPGHEDERLTDEGVAAKLRLMKAAPRLLEALPACVRELRAWMKDHGEDLKTIAAIKAAEAAIAEAEGATSQGARR